MSGEAWSAASEFAMSRVHYQPVPRAELRLAGMSLASITNVPQAQGGSDVTAAGLFSLYLDASSQGASTSASSGHDPQQHDFSAYLRQSRAWHMVMDNEPGHEASRSCPPADTETQATLRSVKRSVPAIFFSEDFDVQDPSTFHAACPIGDHGEGDCIFSLQGHLDMVESSLEREVARRAPELLDVSIDVGKLGITLTGLRDDFNKVRESVHDRKQELEMESTTVSRLRRRKEHMQALERKLAEVIAVRQAVTSLRELLDVSEWLSAAEALAQARTMHRTCTGAKSLSCLASVPAQLDQLQEELCGSVLKAVGDAAEFKGMDEVTLSCCQELQEASSLENFTFHGDLTGHFTSTALGVGLPPTAGADGALPAIWELEQAALWPPFMAAHRSSHLHKSLASFSEAAVDATKAAIASHLYACVQALLKGDRGAGGAVAPPASAPVEDLLQWLRPAAFLALLQSLALLLRVLHWFYEGCGVLMDAALSAVQAVPEDREASSRASRRVLQLVLDTFQRRWARLLEVMYAADLEAYSGSSGGEAAPISLAGFREVADISSEVVKLCASDGRPATALVSILQVLGKHLLKGHASGLQLQLELVLKSEQWSPCAVDVSVQKFLDRLFEAQPNGGATPPEDTGDKHSSTSNGASKHQPPGPTAEQDTADASSDHVAKSATLATALDSAVNSEQAGRRLQGLPVGVDRHQSAGEAMDTALRVGDARFVVVGSAGLLLQHIDALLAFGYTSLALRYEMGSRIAALVRAFDTSSQELLLGAAAISSAGLRSITARHMGVCSQCLLLLEVVLPRLRYMALQGLPAAQVASLATIYESVAEGLVQHRQKIHTKLVFIMRERLSQSMKSLHATAAAWAEYKEPEGPSAAEAAIGAAGATAHQKRPKAIAKMVSQLAKQVTALNEAISPVMSPAQLVDVGIRIRRMYSESLTRALRSLPPGGKNWLLAAEHDVSLLMHALQLMPASTPYHGLDAFVEYLHQIHERIREIDEGTANVVDEDPASTAETDPQPATVTEETEPIPPAGLEASDAPEAEEPGLTDSNGVAPVQPDKSHMAEPPPALQGTGIAEANKEPFERDDSLEDVLEMDSELEAVGDRVGGCGDEPLTAPPGEHSSAAHTQFEESNDHQFSG
eukprot:jgi/Ulvmu1/7606/UM038_0031.1